jgi:ATP-binding cassette subfamily C (CFTR/MRP) protein 1
MWPNWGREIIRKTFAISFWTVAMFLQLLLALFRIIEPASGTIFIDKVDITKLGLHDCAFFLNCLCKRPLIEPPLVRSAISIVPQSPDLFEGTLRENIDPAGEHQDVDIWTALEHVRL